MTGLGIPEIKSAPKPPPSRPPLPKSPMGTPKKAPPKAGVISLAELNQQAAAKPHVYELPQNEAAIYEEIKEPVSVNGKFN